MVHNRLDKSVDYAQNEEKTSLETAIDYALNRDKTERTCFETAINCDRDTVYADMMDTKRRWGKEGRKRKGYHIIQSFAPGEVTPEQAHAVGVELARRLLGDRYEVIVATHLNKEHLSDFIFNIIKAVGVIVLGWGIVQVGMSIQSHDASQRTQGFLCLFGGLMIAFAKEILTAIGAI